MIQVLISLVAYWVNTSSFERVSPKKTIEGTLGGVIGAVLGAICFLLPGIRSDVFGRVVDIRCRCGDIRYHGRSL